MGFHRSQMVQDFFHSQYHSDFPNGWFSLFAFNHRSLELWAVDRCKFKIYWKNQWKNMWSQKSWTYPQNKKLLNLNLTSPWRYLKVSRKAHDRSPMSPSHGDGTKLYAQGYQGMESQKYEESLKNAPNWHGFTMIFHLFPLTNKQCMILVWWILDV